MPAPRIIALSLVALLSACDGSLEADYESMIEYFEENRIGSSSDYVLEKRSALTSKEPVLVLFGFTDSLTACRQIAELFKRDESTAEYQCRRLN